MSEPLLLLLESSGPLCSVAVSKGNSVLGQQEVEEPNSHSSHMAPLADELIRSLSLGLTELDAIVVNQGPGSYTGLRIGASLAKGLCLGLDIPLIAVSSLESIAHALSLSDPHSAHYLALIDARRDAAYAALFNNRMQLVGAERYVQFNTALRDSLPKELLMGGSGADKANALMEADHAVASVRMHAAHLLPSGLRAFQAREFEDLVSFEPNYIKTVHITPSSKNRLI